MLSQVIFINGLHFNKLRKAVLLLSGDIMVLVKYRLSLFIDLSCGRTSPVSSLSGFFTARLPLLPWKINGSLTEFGYYVFIIKFYFIM